MRAVQVAQAVFCSPSAEKFSRRKPALERRSAPATRYRASRRKRCRAARDWCAGAARPRQRRIQRNAARRQMVAMLVPRQDHRSGACRKAFERARQMAAPSPGRARCEGTSNEDVAHSTTYAYGRADFHQRRDPERLARTVDDRVGIRIVELSLAGEPLRRRQVRERTIG